MEKFDIFRGVTAIVLILIFLTILLVRTVFKGRVLTTKLITRVAIFSSIASLLYIIPYLKFSLPFFPSFLEIHFDEVVAMISGFAYGPVCGFLVVFIKTIIKLPFTGSACVGELTDFIYGSILVIVSAIIYKKHRNIKGAFFGLLIASATQVVVSSFLTTFAILDIYCGVYRITREVILGMCHTINPLINNLTWDFLLMVALPFNALKDAILLVLTFIFYKKTKFLIEKATEQIVLQKS